MGVFYAARSARGTAVEVTMEAASGFALAATGQFAATRSEREAASGWCLTHPSKPSNVMAILTLMLQGETTHVKSE
jgi:hypothetical protein